MMTREDVSEKRMWTCPICTDDIVVTLTWRTKGLGLVRTMVVDDMDARLHMAWHEMCTCQWEHDHSGNSEQPVVYRHASADCPVH